MDAVTIDARYRAIFARMGLARCDAIIRRFQPASPPEKTAVLVVSSAIEAADGESLAVFFKLYHYQSPSWRFVGRSSKARCEFDNYEVFERLGVACAERIAWGGERDWLGRLRRAFIITKAIPNAGNLVEFVQKFCPDRSTAGRRQMRAALATQLAAMTQRLHAAQFFHHDLVWRNVLVEYATPGEPKLWWIDCPRGHFDRWSPLRHRRLLKDLASLAKGAMKFCTRGERLEFVKHYLGKPRLDNKVKRLAREAVAYGRRRWPNG